MSQASRKRKSSSRCEQPCGMRLTRCVCIAARDRLVEALIPPSTPLGPYEREEMMLEFSTARTWCEYCEPDFDGVSVCSCYQARKRAWEMKGPQGEPTFPSLFDIRPAEIEEELAITQCRFCNSEKGCENAFVDNNVPPLNLLRWTQAASLLPQLGFVDVRPLSPPCARIASAPPLNRPRVSERVAKVE